MPSYGSKLPPPKLTPASFTLRGAGLLVTAAFLVSILLMGVLVQFVGMSSIELSKDNEYSTLGLNKRDIALTSTQVLHHLDFQSRNDTKGTDNVRISISFNRDHPITPGQFVPMDEAQKTPSILIESHIAHSTERYTYVLVDIDAPDPKAPTHAPFLHYILANLTANVDNDQDRLQHKVVVVSYYPVTPPVGEHRYVSLLFRQHQSAPKPLDEIKRTNFDVIGFALTNKLEIVTSSSFHSHAATQNDW